MANAWDLYKAKTYSNPTHTQVSGGAEAWEATKKNATRPVEKTKKPITTLPTLKTSGGTSSTGSFDALWALPQKAKDIVKNTDRQTLLDRRNILESRRESLRSANVGGVDTFSHANDSNATRIRELDDEIASVDRFLDLQNQIELQPYKQKVTPAREALSRHSIQTNLARRSRGFTYEDAKRADEKASELRREVEKKQRGVEGIQYKQNYQDITQDSSFTGQFSANYDIGQMGEDEALAWNTYLNDPTEENRIYAESVSAAREAYMARNQEALEADTGNSWISKDLAGYLPQFLGQNIAGIKGGLGGAAAGTVLPVAGTAAGAKAGYAAGRALYGYETARGRVFKSLLDAGVPEDQARLAANDEAIVSSVIEGGDAVIDMLTLGFGNLLKKGGTAAAKSTLPKILRNYGINIGSEGLQEWTQEGVSIANQKRNDTGILNLVQESAGQMGRAISGQDPEALEQMNQAGLTGLKIAAMMGGGIAFNTALSKATSPLMLPTADQENGYQKITEQDAINQFNQNVNNRTAFVPDNPLVNTLPTVSDALYYAPGSPAYRGAQSAMARESDVFFTFPRIQKEKNRPAIPDAGASAGPEGNAQSALPQGPSKAIILPGGQEVNQQVGPERSVGAARKGFDPYSAFLGTKSEFFPEGANAARPVDVPTTDAEGNPIRKTAAMAMGAKAIPDEVVGDIQNMVMSGDLSYKRVTDRDSINRAISRIKADGFQRALGDFSDAVQKGVVSKDMMRYDDEVDLSKYEQGIKNLIDTFVNATDITTVVKPVSIGDEKAMKKLLEHMDSNESRADAIKTRIESKLKQIRYDDPLLFEEFSSKIKKTIDLYNETRDADAYLESMKIATSIACVNMLPLKTWYLTTMRKQHFIVTIMLIKG